MSETEVRDVAMRLLAQREHSCCELQRKLRARKYDADIIDRILGELKTANLQSDARFAESYTQMKIRRGFGPVRIRQELRDRGIEDELIEQCLAIIDSDEWVQVVAEVRYKKFGKKIPNDFTRRAKQMRFLQYRGFDSEQIKQGMKNINENG